MLGKEAAVVCPHNVAERGINWLEINLVTFFSVQINIGGL